MKFVFISYKKKCYLHPFWICFNKLSLSGSDATHTGQANPRIVIDDGVAGLAAGKLPVELRSRGTSVFTCEGLFSTLAPELRPSDTLGDRLPFRSDDFPDDEDLRSESFCAVEFVLALIKAPLTVSFIESFMLPPSLPPPRGSLTSES
jgi:hypothetical protein